MKRALLPLLLISALLTGTGCTAKTEYLSAKDWESKHPDIHASYLENKEMEATTYGGSIQVDYLEKYPYLKTLYEGYGFSIEYLRARGHVYALEDVMGTERPKPGASCLSCKTSDFLKHLEENGVKGNAMKFEDVAKAEMETISCYDCHKNEPGTLHVTREHLNVALKGINKEFKPAELACAQCHVEYYLEPENKAVVMPSVNGQTPEAMLTYYDQAKYSDWVHPRSGTPLVKVQHPEWETFQDSLHDKMGLSCTDCHMPDAKKADGSVFPSHHWTSPLKTIEASCLPCHKDDTADSLKQKVETLQGGVETQMNATAERIVILINELDAATKAGKPEATLTQAREKHRQAQWYWDFVFVENSEGFHNNALSKRLLDQAATVTEEALALLK